jgi:hypothetical protein
VALVGCGRLGFDSPAPNGGGGGGGQGTMPGAPGQPVSSNGPGGDDTVDAQTFSAPTTVGLTAYWTFDDPTGGDSSGNANNANCRDGSACPGQVAGVVGNAASFDGGAECFTVPSMTTWNAPQFTVSAWINTPTMAAAQNGSVFVHESSSGCPSPELQIGDGVAGIVQLNTTDSTHNIAFTPTAMLSVNTWRQVAITWDGTTQAVYINGVCDCSHQPTLQPLDNNAELTIGCYPDSGATYTGAIDELRVYDRVLTLAEIGDLYSYASQQAVTPASCSATCNTTPPASP